MFSYAYGSYWVLDPEAKALAFAGEAGAVSPEFRAATLGATAREGQGLHGRAWRDRDLVFIPDLAADEWPRAAAAARAGLTAAVCFPVVAGGEVIATVDLFAGAGTAPSPERLGVMRDVGRVVSASAERVRRETETARLSSMVESSPNNIMYADRELKIRYVNLASVQTLKRIQHLLPVKAEEIVGRSIDVFHERPEH